MVGMRKIITRREMVLSELGVTAERRVVRAVGMAVILNPVAGRFVDDLRPLFEAGAMLGERLMPDLVKLLDGPAVSYGKGALVGDGARRRLRPPDAWKADAGRGWRWEGGDLLEREGRPRRREPRCAARPQGRLLVIPALRHDNRLGG